MNPSCHFFLGPLSHKQWNEVTSCVNRKCWISPDCCWLNWANTMTVRLRRKNPNWSSWRRCWRCEWHHTMGPPYWIIIIILPGLPVNCDALIHPLIVYLLFLPVSPPLILSSKVNPAWLTLSRLLPLLTLTNELFFPSFCSLYTKHYDIKTLCD